MLLDLKVWTLALNHYIRPLQNLEMSYMLVVDGGVFATDPKPLGNSWVCRRLHSIELKDINASLICRSATLALTKYGRFPSKLCPSNDRVACGVTFLVLARMLYGYGGFESCLSYHIRAERSLILFNKLQVFCTSNSSTFLKSTLMKYLLAVLSSLRVQSAGLTIAKHTLIPKRTPPVTQLNGHPHPQTNS